MNFNDTGLKIGILSFIVASTISGYAFSHSNEAPENPFYSSHEYQDTATQYNEMRKFTSIGKSSIINEANQLIDVDYSICDYYFDSRSAPYEKDVFCRNTAAQIAAFASLDIQLNRPFLSNDVYHYQELFITRIRSETSVQYYITDPLDAFQYSQYVSKLIYGTLYPAMRCSVTSFGDLFIYETPGSFICK